MSAEPEGTGWTWQRKGCRIIDKHGRKVAEVNVSYCDEAELNRRGCVLAASKDLLAALQGLVDEWDKFTRYGSPMAKAANERVEFARAAIARAVEVK